MPFDDNEDLSAFGIGADEGLLRVSSDPPKVRPRPRVTSDITHTGLLFEDKDANRVTEQVPGSDSTER